MQIIIQKQYIVLAEVAENIFVVFLVIVNFVFTLVDEAVDKITNKTRNFLQALFGFNIYKLAYVSGSVLETRTSDFKNAFKSKDFLIYSNLLAPPKM